jgi:hypothetical protein
LILALPAGLGNKFLANIRQTDAIVHVVRCFVDDDIIHVDGHVDPMRYNLSPLFDIMLDMMVLV